MSVEGDQGKPNVEFTQDGVLKAAELKIMNLRPGVSKQLVWEEVSTKVAYVFRHLLKNVSKIQLRRETSRDVCKSFYSITECKLTGY